MRIEDGVGYFEITGFYGRRIRITAGGESVPLEIKQDDLENVVIDLSPARRRDVVLVFSVPPDAPLDGVVGFNYHEEGTRGFLSGRAEIVDGQALCRVPVPCRFMYNIGYYQGKRPVGYWFAKSDPIEIPAGDGPFVIEVPVYPAGAICGQVLGPDGSVASDASVSLLLARKPDFVGPELNDITSALTSGALDRGRFNATPLPLGGEYALVANLGNYYYLTGPLRLDEANPVIEIDIHLGHGVTLTGYLIDADGMPAQDPIQLAISVHGGATGRSSRTDAITPDENGVFAIENVNPELNGKYFIHVNAPGYRPVRQEILDIHAPVEIRLEKGLRLTGVVIDDATGWPVPGAEVYAYASRTRDGILASELLEAENKTNQRGEFVFSNMTT